MWAVPRSEFVHWQWYSKPVTLFSVELEHSGRVAAPVCAQTGGKDMGNSLVQLVNVSKQTHRPLLFTTL